MARGLQFPNGQQRPLLDRATGGKAVEPVGRRAGQGGVTWGNPSGRVVLPRAHLAGCAPPPLLWQFTASYLTLFFFFN